MSAQFTLYAHPGPNTLKVTILLEKLGLSYKLIPLAAFSDDAETGVKGKNFLAINPNGRVPAMIDHHANDFTVWESGAILLYITDVYDKQGLYYGKTAQERAISAQWLTYQLSGLGPVQGSLTFAHRFWEMSYGEKPSDMVIKRFEDESHRLYKVLDGQLAKQKWIALDRPGIADFAFFVWVRIAYAGNLDISSYTHVVKWRDALEADKDVIEALAKYPKLQ